MTRLRTTTKQTISKEQIRRSVASSSAIETGESSKEIENRLSSGKRRFPRLTLAS